jgi:ABC-type glutathione transport system ATPase component
VAWLENHAASVHMPDAHSLSRIPVPAVLSVKDLSKTYASGFEALKSINLDIERGEIFALLGPNLRHR